MPYTTDERLKSYLDTNQLAREQMCLSVLALDKRFSDVKPRHPRGGPDGGRDLEATYLGSQPAFGAVGFLNQANDSDEHRRRVLAKFESDLQVALAAQPKLGAFVFFTNVNLSVTEKDTLNKHARSRGIVHCEVFDRERIRICLDNPDGFAIRFQYLQIPLSEAEQASFFSKWGDEIQGIITNGFGKLEKTLNRLQFLAETGLPLQHFTLFLDLDKTYPASDIGHFRAFCYLELKEVRSPVMGYLFGSTDNPNRSEAKSPADLDLSKGGIGRGRCGGRWDVVAPSGDLLGADDEDVELVTRSTFTSVGLGSVSTIQVEFSYSAFYRVPPYLLLRDLDEASFALFLNRALADRVQSIHVYANEYKLGQYLREALRIDTPPAERAGIPMHFAESELADEWVRIMNGIAAFRVSFSDTTPLRVIRAAEIESD